MLRLTAADGDPACGRPLVRRAMTLGVIALAFLASGCDGRSGAAPARFGRGDPQRGAALIAGLGCGTCHAIPGIAGADGRIGPPLGGIATRTTLAGVLPNTPENMLTWLKTPQSVVPGNAMPNMELNDNDAKDVAAYLYTLR